MSRLFQDVSGEDDPLSAPPAEVPKATQEKHPAPAKQSKGLFDADEDDLFGAPPAAPPPKPPTENKKPTPLPTVMTTKPIFRFSDADEEEDTNAPSSDFHLAAQEDESVFARQKARQVASDVDATEDLMTRADEALKKLDLVGTLATKPATPKRPAPKAQPKASPALFDFEPTAAAAPAAPGEGDLFDMLDQQPAGRPAAAAGADAGFDFGAYIATQKSQTKGGLFDD